MTSGRDSNLEGRLLELLTMSRANALIEVFVLRSVNVEVGTYPDWGAMVWRSGEVRSAVMRQTDNSLDEEKAGIGPKDANRSRGCGSLVVFSRPSNIIISVWN